MNPKDTVKILDIDLYHETILEREIENDVAKLYPDGVAFGLYVLLQEMDSNAEPLSPANILVFTYDRNDKIGADGNHLIITTKSPINAKVGDSKVESDLPQILNSKDIVAMIIRGKAKKPVFIYMNENQYEMRDAAKLWGKVTGESERMIREEFHSEELEMAQIGPAGENMVRYSCIITMKNRANGRNGTGAVMGSKNLKAIVSSKAI
ncbi:aldehyde ferredoxin oxidoreductase N-terminal domain-containing protein [Tindallia californiensis]|uniref:Aldehyde:ferredoxin oxidoreductase n=1 Tax=Tindallia californiensis TaxID=159292 RepID=A0A1H3JW94_9FIRM|nr:aldehyde ferredoxin oxidoreductase N-terminal domain-containing protein [Tindallia californiensis]SDY44141.1 aldehyde:ferredoxin oxidoreductase [Tindallia californiensis]